MGLKTIIGYFLQIKNKCKIYQQIIAILYLKGVSSEICFSGNQAYMGVQYIDFVEEKNKQALITHRGPKMAVQTIAGLCIETPAL